MNPEAKNPNKYSFKLSRLFYYLESLCRLILAMPLDSLALVFSDWIFLRPVKTIRLKKFHLCFKILNILDLLTVKEVILDNEYESLGAKIDSQCRIAVDVGAGFGDFSIFTAKRFPKIKIAAYEPHDFYSQLLTENIAINKTDNITVHKRPVNSIGEMLKENNLKTCDFLKIDCEGCEFGIIGESKEEDLRKVKKIVMEYHESNDKTAILLSKRLKSAGFSVRVSPRKSVFGLGLLSAVLVKSK